jgi:predicted transposase YbfD/YdcC
VLQVKGNQPKLRARIAAWHQADPTPAQATWGVQERSRGRVCAWQASVYPCSEPDVLMAWQGLARVVVVVKTVQRAQETTQQTRYYLTSLRTTPLAALAAGIRGHWGIENRLHRTRDIHFKQDKNGIRHPRAAANRALFNTMALNYLLLNVHQAVSYAQLLFAQNFKQFLPLMPRS